MLIAVLVCCSYCVPFSIVLSMTIGNSYSTFQATDSASGYTGFIDIFVVEV